LVNVGGLDGETLGADGIALGILLGIRVGIIVGVMVGFIEGLDGDIVGFTVDNGEPLGMVVGDEDGDTLGMEVGSDVGDTVSPMTRGVN